LRTEIYVTGFWNQEIQKRKEVLANMPGTIIRILLIAVAILSGRNIIQEMRPKGRPNINM
jgi:hypothetical protein